MTQATIEPRTRPALWMDEPGTNGRRRIRVGWSAREAGLLASDPPIPSRTVEHWAATGLVGPTVYPHKTWPRYYRNRHSVVYGLGDVIAVRLAKDLLDHDVDRYAVEELCALVAGWDPRSWRNWRGIAATPDVAFFIVTDSQGVRDFLDMDLEPGRFEQSALDAVDEEEGEELVDVGGGWYELRYFDDDGTPVEEEPTTVYPIGAVAAEVVARVDGWAAENVGAAKTLAGWM